jgi:hypothetical protein
VSGFVPPRLGNFAVAMTTAHHHDVQFTIWSAARAEANLAYEAWCEAPGSDAYAVYRAAEDRADAAEQALAWAARPLVAVA